MATMLQQDRPLQLETVLGPDKLLLRGLTGTEAISRPFSFLLDLTSDDPAIDGGDLLRTPVTLTLSLPDGKERQVHAVVNRFFQLGRHEDLIFYQAELVPRLWFAGLVHDCRIFQNSTVPEIVEEILKKYGLDYQFQCTAPHPQREYCVQYRESDLDFVSRLMEDEGIFYWFDHSGDSDVVVIADANSAFPPCPDQDTARMAVQEHSTEDVVLSLFREQAVHTSKVTYKSYDYLQPPLSLIPSVDSTVTGFGEELYDFPGDYTTDDEGYRRARLRIEAEEARQQILRGTSGCRAFQAGTHFKLEGHFNSALDVEYLLTEVRHDARAGDVRSGGGNPFTYVNGFTAIPTSVPYRPPRLTPRPVIFGTQTAMVVGPSGQEVYTDAHARVKVQFHWDRLGKRDENSSCWIRYAQPWAGKAWGSAAIPRIGNEVVVSFLEGDPDRPLITGSVYNADQTPPFGLPGANIQMGMKSRSSPGGGGYNEISMTDTKGKEGLNIHAQYDMTTTVEHDETTTVKNNDTQKVLQKRSIDVGDTQTEHVKGAVTENYDATQATTVKNNIDIKSTNGAIAILSDAQHVFIQAATNIQLHVGSSMIWMDKGGQINIKGVDVAINGSNSVTIKGTTIHSEATAENQTKGAIVLSEGSATNTVKGGMVMLNP